MEMAEIIQIISIGLLWSQLLLIMDNFSILPVGYHKRVHVDSPGHKQFFLYHDVMKHGVTIQFLKP